MTNTKTKADDVVDVVVDDTELILSNMDYYLSYIRQSIRDILADDGLQYSEPMDSKKTYPAFTYKQFVYILNRLYDRVYSQNLALLQSQPYVKPKLYDIYTNSKIRYDVPKVELAYAVYYRLCTYYGFVVCWENFMAMTGIAQETLEDWLSCGRSKLLKRAKEDNKISALTDMENSNAPILRMASANYKHGMTTPSADRDIDMVADHLPDLLALPDGKKPSET